MSKHPANLLSKIVLYLSKITSLTYCPPSNFSQVFCPADKGCFNENYLDIY